MACVFCKREVLTRRHHIVPKCKSGENTVEACESCEGFIHSTWSHNELRDTFNNVETISGNEKFQKFLSWLLKQKPGVVFKSNKGKDRVKHPYR